MKKIKVGERKVYCEKKKVITKLGAYVIIIEAS